jgi:hypothetical protein
MSIADLNETRVQNEILSTTAEAIHPGILENALDAHPGASIFFGKIGAVLGGMIGADGSPSGTAARAVQGESIKVRVKLDTNGAARRLASGYSAFSQDTSDTIRGGRANWKLYGTTAVMSGLERRNNRGSAQLADLWNHKHTDATSALVDMIAQDLFSTASPANAITSLDALIGAGGTTVQGLAANTYTKWASRGLQDKGTAIGSISFTPGTTSFASAGLANMRKAHLNATEGSYKPNVLITDDNTYLFYEASLVPQVRFTSNDSVGKLGFSSLEFRDSKIFHDYYCTSGYMYFINTETLFSVYSEGAFFNMSPVMDQAFQDAFSVKVIYQGNLVCNGRKFNNKITGFTA